MRLPKIVRAGIEFHLPMWWTAYNRCLIMQVQTGFYENGRGHSQKVWRLVQIEAALRRSLELLKMGANLDVNDLVRFRMEVNYWELGWDPDLIPLREEVWQAQGKLWIATNWKGWRDYRRGTTEVVTTLGSARG